MIRGILFNFLFFLSITTIAQTYIVKGSVKDSNGELLPFANVFFAETTYGTTTDNEGRFELRIEKAGTYDLVVRFVGYRTYAAQIKLSDQREYDLSITLEEDAITLGSVTVTGEKDERWQYNIQEFRYVFLGVSANARKCKIKNEDDVDFIEDEDAGILEAFSREPIIIENKALGYLIKYYLEEFKIDYKSGMSSYYGYTSFEKLKGSKRQERRWEEARTKAYNGSIVHFFSSLYENKLKEEGFKVQIAQDVKGFGRVLNPREADIGRELVVGNTELSKRLPFENYLYITYTKESESKDYSDYQSKFGGRHASVSFEPKRPQQSWISIVEGYEDIEFEESGYVYNPIAFLSAGYWGFEKVAEMVPINYRPQSENN